MLTAFAGSYADYRAWERTITCTASSAYRRRIVVQLVDLDHRPIADLTQRFLGGEVTGDTTRQPTRVATLELLDPSRSLQFEPDSPTSVPLHLSRMIRINYSVYVPALERWVGCPVFTGPIVDFDRDGVIAKITCHGKDELASGQAGRSRTWPKKTRKTTVIRGMLVEAGETRFDFPDDDQAKTTLPEPVTVRSADSWWTAARRLAGSLDRQLFYDGRGVATLRRLPGRASFTFDRRTLASEVAFDRDPSGLRNRWIITGAKPRGAKKRVHVDLRLPPKHPLSGQSLGRTVGAGQDAVVKPRWLIERVENEGIKTTKEARARAVRLRDDALRFSTTISFASLPIPHLEENDLVRVVTDEGSFTLRLRQWTLPLSLEGAPTMSVGSLRRTTVATPRMRSKGTRSTGADPFSAARKAS